MPRAQRLDLFASVYWKVLDVVVERGKYTARFDSKKQMDRARNKFYAFFKSIEERGEEGQKEKVKGVSIRASKVDGDYWIELSKSECDDLVGFLEEGLESGVVTDEEAELNRQLDQLGGLGNGL